MDIADIQTPLSPEDQQRLKDIAQQVKEGLITKREAVRLSKLVIEGKAR